MSYPGPDFVTISGKIKSFVSGPTTERLLIIGTAVDGPLNIPRQIRDTAEAERIFGPATYSNGYKNPVTSTQDNKDNFASIPRAIAQAIATGATDIWVCRATGTYATSPSAFSSALELKALFPGRIYNEVTVSIAATGGLLTVVVNQPSAKGETYTTQYSSALTLSEVIDRMNGDRRNRTFEVIRDTYTTYLSSACTTIGTSAFVSATLAGGTNGTNAPGEDYATSLAGYATKLTTTDTGTFDSLLGRKERFNICVLTGIHLDDQVVVSGTAKPTGGTWSAAEEYTTSIATDFVHFLDQASSQIAPCRGVIACRPPAIRSTASLITFCTDSLLSSSAGFWNQGLKWTKAGYFLYTGWTRTDPVAGVVDLGQRLSVVAGPDVVYSHPKLGNYTDMFHVSYAGMLTTLPPERAPIFKPIPGVLAYGTQIPAKYERRLVEGVGFSPANDLSGKGAYVVLTRNPRDPDGAMVIFDDVTAAARDDFMRNDQLVHLCNNIHWDLDNSLSGFLGGPTSAATLAAMETSVQNVMDGYVLSNALKGKRGVGYDFQITMQGPDQALGIVRVFIEIAPATALRKIYFVVAVRQGT